LKLKSRIVETTSKISLFQIDLVQDLAMLVLEAIVDSPGEDMSHGIEALAVLVGDNGANFSRQVKLVSSHITFVFLNTSIHSLVELFKLRSLASYRLSSTLLSNQNHLRGIYM
jgi:hypothetical protein